MATSLILDTIAGMRKAAGRDEEDDDFLRNPPRATNRGSKLKRKADSVHEGQLSGLRRFKRKIEYAGYQRHILFKNPLRYDEYGYELEDDEEDDEADDEAALRNPYSSVTLEKLFMPLIAASDLESHPTLSIPYTSKMLPSMVQTASDMLQKERKSLVEMKLLLTKFRGDHAWIPCGRASTDDDAALFTPGNLPSGLARLYPGEHDNNSKHLINAQAPLTTEVAGPVIKEEPDVGRDHMSSTVADDPMIPEVSIISQGQPRARSPNAPKNCGEQQGPKLGQSSTDTGDDESTSVGPDMASQRGNGNKRSRGPSHEPALDLRQKIVETEPVDPDLAAEGSTAQEHITPLRMVTRGQAQAQASALSITPKHRIRSDSLSSGHSIPPIHSLFIPPLTAIPDRDCGLPENEAEDTRRILSALTQKQEEVVRGAEQLYNGLLTAHRLIRTVWSWCKAEGHTGEMSDGEDWVDLEEIGLEGPLKKGQSEAEDSSEKKTRARRVAA